MLRESAALAAADRRLLADPPVRGRERAARGRAALPRGPRLPRRVRPGRRPRTADDPRPRHPPVDREVARLAESRHRRGPLPGLELLPRLGAMPLDRYRDGRDPGRAGFRRGGRTGAVDLRQHARRGLRPERPARPRRPRARPPPRPARLAAAGHARGGPCARAGRQIGSLEAGKEADIIAVDPRARGAGPGIDSDDPAEITSRLAFRPHPAMVRAAWVRGRRLDGPTGLEVRRDRGLDILIEGGTVVDGTGAPGSPGPWRSRGGSGSCAARPRSRRPRALQAGRRSTPRGHVVAPGFIDLHSHSGLMILAEPRHEPKVRQGVTTEVIGVDGNAYAPFPTPGRPRRLRRAQRRARRLARTTSTTTGGRSPSTSARFDARVSVNIAYLVGNSALRIAAVGWDDVAADARPARDRCGRCSARRWRRAPSGCRSGLDYPPGAYATTDELAELAGRGGGARRLLPHPRPLRAGRSLPRPVPRGDRDRPPGRRRPSTSPTSTTATTFPGSPSKCSGWSTTPAPRAST